MAAPPHVAGRTLGGGSPGALLRLGQVANDRAANGLRRYFSQVEDFDVEVDLLGLRSEGGRTIVRFFRPDGLEKEVVQTPEGLRFAPGRG